MCQILLYILLNLFDSINLIKLLAALRSEYHNNSMTLAHVTMEL